MASVFSCFLGLWEHVIYIVHIWVAILYECYDHLLEECDLSVVAIYRYIYSCNYMHRFCIVTIAILHAWMVILAVAMLGEL